MQPHPRPPFRPTFSVSGFSLSTDVNGQELASPENVGLVDRMPPNPQKAESGGIQMVNARNPPQCIDL
jgi:hypothetical protein